MDWKEGMEKMVGKAEQHSKKKCNTNIENNFWPETVGLFGLSSVCLFLDYIKKLKACFN